MEPESPRERSRLLREAAGHLTRAAQEHFQVARQQFDATRNLLQVVWLMREARRRLRERGDA
jgi:hypothetical protein